MDENLPPVGLVLLALPAGAHNCMGLFLALVQRQLGLLRIGQVASIWVSVVSVPGSAQLWNKKIWEEAWVSRPLARFARTCTHEPMRGPRQTFSMPSIWYGRKVKAARSVA